MMQGWQSELMDCKVVDALRLSPSLPNSLCHLSVSLSLSISPSVCLPVYTVVVVGVVVVGVVA